MIDWSHLLVLPIVLPLMAAASLLLSRSRSPILAMLSTLAGLFIALTLIAKVQQSGAVHAYLLGNWVAPFGITLVLDRLSALMLLLTSLLGCVSLLYALAGDDQRGRYFHSLFQFQLMGLNGAFLTGDLFNLFVFFEVLLISSYGLLLHGATAERLRSSVHYVVFNLAGSALFLIAASLLYGVTGTLNFADMAIRVAQLPNDKILLVQSAGLLLIVVFCVKAALLPLYFWLPATYGAASAPVAALFAIMTKVGIYAILRVTTLIFGASGGAAAMLASPWLESLALATIALGAIGAFSAKTLRLMIGNLVVASAGTLLLTVGLATVDTVAAGLFYLVNSTLATAALFLLADRIVAARVVSTNINHDAFVPVSLGDARVYLGILFFIFAVAAAAMPPSAGFLGKALLLKAATQFSYGWLITGVVLASSVVIMVTFARSGSMLFWRGDLQADSQANLRSDWPIDHESSVESYSVAKNQPGTVVTEIPIQTNWQHKLSLAVLATLLAICSVYAGTLADYTKATAVQLFERRAYIEGVLGAKAAPAAIDVRKEMREQVKP